jgi:hypothetical protein
LYCLSPGERPAPTLQCPAEAACGGLVRCALGTAQAADATVVVRLEVYDPAGRLRTCYSGPRLLGPGRPSAEAGFALALNDPPGRWILRAVELVSGKTVERTMIVKD